MSSQPTKITKETVTAEQIRRLQIEAAVAGDKAMVDTCDRAFAGSLAAKDKCAKAINEANSYM